MPRIPRIVGIGYPHHIIQRGNNKEKIFNDEFDYRKYLSLLERYAIEKDAVILAYCLMPNHVHLLVRPRKEMTLSKLMQGITLCYTQYFNKKYKRSGRLWECRYYSTIIDEERYLWSASKYIENNPVRGGIVKNPEDYNYSSAKAHLLGKKDSLLKEPLFDKSELNEYRIVIKKPEDKLELDEIRKQTRLGKPLGDKEFLVNLSEKLGLSLSFRPKGRPKQKRGVDK